MRQCFKRRQIAAMVVFPALVHDANHLRSNNAADQAPSLLVAVTLANQPWLIPGFGVLDLVSGDQCAD